MCLFWPSQYYCSYVMSSIAMLRMLSLHVQTGSRHIRAVEAETTLQQKAPSAVTLHHKLHHKDCNFILLAFKKL